MTTATILIQAFANDEDGAPAGEYHFQLSVRRDGDDWAVDAARITSPDEPVRLRLGEPVAALIREVVAELYGQPVSA